MAVGVYGLIGVTPMVPKRFFLRIPMFFLAGMLAMFTLAIFRHQSIELIAFSISTGEMVLGMFLVACAVRTGSAAGLAGRRDDGGPRVSWPLVSTAPLGERGIRRRHLSGFVLVNMFVLRPLVAGYVFFFSARAVNRFSEGFAALHPGGITVQMRKYVRDDGKMIELFPMAHIADPSFYREVSQSFPTNSVILMEGVSDSENLLTNKITYKRMATSLGLAEQKETFAPGRGEVVRADVDVKQFSKSTIDFLNLVMLFHSRGVTSENLSRMMQYTRPPVF